MDIDFIVFLLLGVLIVLIIIINISNYSKKIKTYKNKKQMLTSNLFINDNKNKFNVIIDNNINLTYRYVTLLLLDFVIFILLTGILYYCHESLNMGLVLIIGGLLAFGICETIMIVNKSYKKAYKNIVIKKVLNEYSKGLDYFPFEGINKEEYNLCNFDELISDYNAEGLIIDKTNSIKLSNITASKYYRDDTVRTVFNGILAHTTIANVNCKIFIGSAKKTEGLKKITINHEQFDKLFSLYSDNEAKTREILTPNVIEDIVKIKDTLIKDIDAEIRIINDSLYVRLSVGNLFIPHLFNKRLEKESMLNSLAVLQETINIVNQIKKILH